MRIKDGNKEIPLRDSITGIDSKGLYTPISIDLGIKNNNENILNMTFSDSFLIDNIISDSLNITKELDGNKIKIEQTNKNNLKNGKGITIDSDNNINIDTRKFVDDKTINSDFIQWSGYGTYIKADLKDDKKAFFENTTIKIYESNGTEKMTNYLIECNDNLEKTPKKITILKIKGAYLFPFHVKPTEVMTGGITLYNNSLAIIYGLITFNKPISLYYAKPSYQKADVSLLG